MARPVKTGLEYFALDTDFFSDLSIRYLKANHGPIGITLYLYILCYIYKDKGYYIICDEQFILIASEELKTEVNQIREIIKYLINNGLLIEKKISKDIIAITSRRIQRNYQAGVRERAKKNKVSVKKDIWIIPEDETEKYININ